MIFWYIFQSAECESADSKCWGSFRSIGLTRLSLKIISARFASLFSCFAFLLFTANLRLLTDQKSSSSCFRNHRSKHSKFSCLQPVSMPLLAVFTLKHAFPFSRHHDDSSFNDSSRLFTNLSNVPLLFTRHLKICHCASVPRNFIKDHLSTSVAHISYLFWKATSFKISLLLKELFSRYQWCKLIWSADLSKVLFRNHKRSELEGHHVPLVPVKAFVSLTSGLCEAATKIW